jgi:hypothetical protein
MVVDRHVTIVPESRPTRRNFLRELRFMRKYSHMVPLQRCGFATS